MYIFPADENFNVSGLDKIAPCGSGVFRMEGPSWVAGKEIVIFYCSHLSNYILWSSWCMSNLRYFNKVNDCVSLSSVLQKFKLLSKVNQLCDLEADVI